MCRAVAPAARPARPGAGRRQPAAALPCPVRCVVGGDGLSLSIAAASIVAKVVRDRAMARLAARFPGYGWGSNVGYATRVPPRRRCAGWGRPGTTGRASARSRQLASISRSRELTRHVADAPSRGHD